MMLEIFDADDVNNQLLALDDQQNSAKNYQRNLSKKILSKNIVSSRSIK
jgi:hypothetical protein